MLGKCAELGNRRGRARHGAQLNSVTE
jgi:hypothetical protein